MNVDKVKLYELMSHKEKAQLAFKEVIGGDSFEEITSTIKRSAWIVNDPRFSTLLDGLYLAGMIWSFEYQKIMGLAATSLVACSASDDSEIKAKAMQAYDLNINKLNVLFCLLDDMDASHGLDFMTVCELAEVRNVFVKRASVSVVCPKKTEIKGLPVTLDHSLKDDHELGVYYQGIKSMLVVAITKDADDSNQV